jgi:DNA ligase 1
MDVRDDGLPGGERAPYPAVAMNDLADGEETRVQGSGSSVYTLKNSGGVYSCTCPAWMHQSLGIERRTCKHLRALRGDEAETARVGQAAMSGRPVRPKPVTSAGEPAEEDEGPPVLLAHKWESHVDVTGWWLSEKLDGVRAYWDGSQFLSRLGNRFFPPPWFVAGLPSFPLDGELWGGRKLFQRTVGIVKRQDQSPLWKDLLYVVFDAPSHGGVFEERMEHLEEVVRSSENPYLRMHVQSPCTGFDQLRAELARVEGLGGEGLMARRPKSKYEVGRSTTLLKIKTFHDAEARVVGHAPGAGRHKGRVGSLLVELADGTQFNVGTGLSDRDRESPPPIGALITFRYQELSDGGVPRFPSYVGLRIDAPGPSAELAKAPAPIPQAPKPPAAPAAPQPPAAPARGMAGARYFEFVDGSSSKFWEITIEGTSLKARYGRIGTNGQTTLKTFASEDQARREAEKLIQEKTKKGYVEK